MGRAFSVLKREAVNYNVENRAFKIISSDVPRPAPKYPSTLKAKAMTEEYGIKVEDLLKKNQALDSNLKSVYVVSHDPKPEEPTKVESDKSLPLNRITDYTDMNYGYLEPESIPVGRISLKKTLELLSKHCEDSEKWTVERLAHHYKLESNVIEQLIHRYKVFSLFVPDQNKSEVINKEWKDKLKYALSEVEKIAVIAGPSDKRKEPERTGPVDLKQPA